MKKIVVLALLFAFSTKLVAQGGADKAFRFGLKIAPSLNWIKPDDNRKFQREGNSLGFNFGLAAEIALSELFSIETGLEVNFERGKLSYLQNTHYFLTDEYDFVKTQEHGNTGTYGISDTTTPYAQLQVSQRMYHNTYVTIPAIIKMKTNEIGYMTYFGQFGVNLGVRTKTRVSDVAIPVINNTNNPFTDLKEINHDKDMLPVRAQLVIGGGGEYSLSGETSLVIGLQYNLGFTNLALKNSRYLVNDDGERVKQDFTTNAFRINLGILF